jgi:MarR family transcriptional regulator, organic hydroperoxide resistance regulator
MARRTERLPISGETLQFMKRMWDLVHALDVRSKRMARELGVTGPQRLVIRLLGQNPDMTASDIAATLGMHPSTLTGILSRLEAQGMLARRTDADDRRRLRFKLTARGSRVDRERKGTVEASVRRALARSSETTITNTVDFLGVLTDELVRSD